MRLEIVPIHLLRLLGYEGAEETVCAALPMSAVLVGSTGNNVGATIGRPLLRLGRKFVTVILQYFLLPM